MLPRVTVSPGLAGVPADPEVLFNGFIRDFCEKIANDFTKCPHISSGGIFDTDELLNIDIEISDKTPCGYSALGIGGLLKGIKEKWPELPEEAAEKIKESIRSPNITRDWILNVTGIISRYTDENRDEIIRRIKDIMKNPKYYGKSYMLGKYDHGKRRITLYHKSIAKYANDAGRPVEDEYQAVYFHELFHAYHHLCGDKISRELSSRGDYTAEVVKESLAAYFESCYDPAYDRSAWFINSPANWPYAGARYITDKLFFAEIFLMSLTDLDAALRKLLGYDPDEFYDVKNAKCIEKVRSKAGKAKRTP